MSALTVDGIPIPHAVLAEGASAVTAYLAKVKSDRAPATAPATAKPRAASVTAAAPPAAPLEPTPAQPAKE